MDVLSILGSINLIALIFFILVLGFVVFEFVMYLKERKPEQHPTVPQFNPNTKITSPLVQTAPLVMQHMTPLQRRKKNRVVPMVIALIILMALVVFELLNPAVNNRAQTPVVLPDELLTPQPPSSTTSTPQPTSILIPTSVPRLTGESRAGTATRTAAPTRLVPPAGGSGQATKIITVTPFPTEVTTLPQTGSFNSFIVLALAASTVVVVSLIF